MRSLHSSIWVAAWASLTLAASACNKPAEFAGPTLDKVQPKVIVDQEFPAAVIGDRELSFRPAYGLVDDTLTLKEKAAVTGTTRQMERPVGMQEHTQGHDGNQVTQEFTVSSAGKLDLLVVVDDSGSMKEEQDKLSTKLTSLTKELSTVDWRIVVVTTTSSCRRLDRVINKSDADAATAFKNAVTAGVGGSGTERGIRRAIDGFDGICPDGNYTWLRPDSSLAVLFVADENNDCATLNCRNERPIDLVNKMRSLRPNMPDKLKAYAIIWDESNALCEDVNGETAGTRYLEVVNTIGGIGVAGSICEADYKTTLENVSKDVARAIRAEYSLKFAPENDLEVTIDGVPHMDYAIDGKKLTLMNVAASAVKMKVTYNYAAVPRFDRVTVDGDPADDTLEVYVEGKKLAKDDFEYDATTKELVFLTMPADAAAIRVKYRKEGALPAQFDVAQFDMGRLEQVFVKGKASKYEYDATTGVLTLPAPPADGAEIKLQYRVKDGQITRYAAAPTAADAETIVVADAESGDAVEMSVDGDQLVFDAADVIDGRKVTVTYDYGELAAALKYEIPDAPMMETLTVTGKDGEAGCIDDVAVEGQVLTFSCDAEEIGEVVISYQYIAESYVDFVVVGEVGDSDQTHHYQVFVDGKGISDFTHEKGKISVPADLLTPHSKVRIIVTKLE
jgi:hypothetical protein